MTPREFRQEQNLEFNHFQELTSTGIKPNYVNIEMFAHEYHKAKLKLLGITELIKILQRNDLLDNQTYEQQADEILSLFSVVVPKGTLCLDVVEGESLLKKIKC